MCYTIKEIKEKTVPIAEKHGISRMYLFGSYARGEATDDSDVDIFVDKGKTKPFPEPLIFFQRKVSIRWKNWMQLCPLSMTRQAKSAAA